MNFGMYVHWIQDIFVKKMNLNLTFLNENMHDQQSSFFLLVCAREIFYIWGGGGYVYVITPALGATSVCFP